MFTFLARSIMVAALVFFVANLGAELVRPFIDNIDKLIWVEHVTNSSLAVLLISFLYIILELIFRHMYFVRR